MSKGKFTVRFNLGAGENFMKWRVVSPEGNAQYLEPSEVTLYMEDCRLVNQKSTAKKIHEGANKSVCAWIEAKNVVVYHKMQDDFVEGGLKVSYNPRVTPNWVMDGKNVDKKKVGNLITLDRQVLTAK